MPSQELTIVKIAPNNPVFDLPVIVGIEEGLFADAGLDVRFSATYADREKDSADRPIMSRLKKQLFDCGSADSYNVCEWASIDRLGGRLHYGRLEFCGAEWSAAAGDAEEERQTRLGDIVHLRWDGHCARRRTLTAI
jgi:hypothetical protein